MSFVRNNFDPTPNNDPVFKIVAMAMKDILENGKENVINASLGALFDEEEKLVCYPSVFNYLNQLENSKKAKYASAFSGNLNYQKDIYNWLTKNINLNLHYNVMASSGGTGAISLTLLASLNQGDTFLIPNIAWSSYQFMAEQFQFKTAKYNILKDNKFDIEDFKKQCLKLVGKQERIVVIINDPCHNPTGFTLSQEEWREIIEFVDDCSKTTPFIILNDIAYIDYSTKDEPYKFMEEFNNISDNTIIVSAFSLSKSLTSYGLRCGAAVIFAKNQKDTDEVFFVFEKLARSIWSNVNNGAMETFSYIANEGNEQYLKEKQYYIDLLKKRSDLFIKEAEACGLKHYRYDEGFFITLMVDKEIQEKFHQELIKNHIYTVSIEGGIRIAICSLTIEKIKNLAFKIKKILASC